MGTSNGINDGQIIAGAGSVVATTTLTVWSAVAAAGPINFVPVAGQIATGLIAVAVAAYKLAQGCGPTCTESSKFADQAQALLYKNMQEYFAIPDYKRTLDIQRQAMLTFEKVAQALAAACGQAALGAAGQRCISERLVEGGQAPWCPTSDHRGCDWITTMYNPIKNDPAPARNIAAAGVSSVPAQINNAVQGGGSFAQVAGAPILIGGQSISLGVVLLVIAAIILIFIASI